MTLNIRAHGPTEAVSQRLLAQLTAEMDALYPDITIPFSPQEVMVDRAAFLVGWWDGVGIACGALRPATETIAEIKRVFVHPDYRGRGISRQMIGTLEGKAREFGYTAVRLETGTRQPVAIHLYESSGYQRIDCHPTFVADEFSVCYEKSLTQ